MSGHFQGALEYPEALHMDMALLPTLGREDGLLYDTQGLLVPENVLGYERGHQPLGLRLQLSEERETIRTHSVNQKIHLNIMHSVKVNIHMQ